MNEIKEVKAYEYNGQLFATKEEVITERKLFEARMRRVAPGVNLEMIGDRYNDLDTQWKFELWLDRAALAGKGVK